MADVPTPECPNCRRLMALIRELHATYGKRIAELEARIARLERNSSNSHRPPSSDIVKPPPATRRRGRKRRIGGALRAASQPPRVLQQVELIEKPVLVTEHRALTYWCTHCLKAHRAELPAEVRAAALVGTRLTALVGWLKGSAHATCRQQSRSVFEFLHHALEAHFTGQPAPSLLPA